MEIWALLWGWLCVAILCVALLYVLWEEVQRTDGSLAHFVGVGLGGLVIATVLMLAAMALVA